MVSFLGRMETRRLHSTDMKRLVCILRDVPVPGEERYGRKVAHYRKFTKLDIQDLPHRLRSSPLFFGSSGNLCCIHKGLDAHLINDIWAWVKHEFEGAIGQFLYPLIMCDLLTPDQEWRARQMEPVLQMWRQDFDIDASAPPGREPIYCGDKWHYQRDQCPACIMARMASDEDVLSALFAGMTGRMSTKSLTNPNAAPDTPYWAEMSSKRVRFVKYWIRKTRGGERTLYEAGNLGMRLKCLVLERRHQKETLYQTLSGTTVNSSSDTSSNHQKGEHSAHMQDDTKLGPKPRPFSVDQFSPAETLGFDMREKQDYTSTKSYNRQHTHSVYHQDTYQPSPSKSSFYSSYHHHSSHSLSPSDSISIKPLQPAPLGIQKQNPSHHCNSSSTSTPSTILSYTGGPSQHPHHRDPFNNPIYNIVEPAKPHQAESHQEKYRKLLATDNPFAYSTSNFTTDADEQSRDAAPPRPKKASMYFAYWDKKFNGERFDGVDVEPRREEREMWEREGREMERERDSDTESEGSKRCTRWEDFY
ncbi:hypothetical protein COCVIDRAFT_35721 [Bipolaris victoriae FI3]|uniref:Uncharacterized protein n=1 Tax=Bipolaris victoriae (strain FI3) TaxID=930091 RepID=W7EFE4_BIPV3|nr:hypothetical protein COCVIDRAFT_35721 [Bipolaris victoriae FI3]